MPLAEELGLYYEQVGEGRDVLFLHTWSLSSALWQFQIADLASECRATALDFRAHGNSDKPPDAPTLAELTEDLKRLLECLDIEDVILVGWGLGGLVSLNYTVKHGLGVHALVLVGCAPTAWASSDPDITLWPEAVHPLLSRQMERDDPDSLADYVNALFHQTPTERTVSWILDEARKTPPQVRANILGAIEGIDLRSSLRAIEVPTLVCHGHYDRFAPIGAGHYLVRAIPRATLAEFNNSGHTPHLEELNRFNEELIAFIEACGRGERG